MIVWNGNTHLRFLGIAKNPPGTNPCYFSSLVIDNGLQLSLMLFFDSTDFPNNAILCFSQTSGREAVLLDNHL